MKYTENEQSENTNTEHDESDDERFWKQSSYHTPEDRIAIAERVMKKQEKKNHTSNKSNPPKRVLKLFAPDGRAYNINQAKVSFRLNDEDDPDFVVLEVSVYR